MEGITDNQVREAANPGQQDDLQAALDEGAPSGMDDLLQDLEQAYGGDRISIPAGSSDGTRVPPNTHGVMVYSGATIRSPEDVYPDFSAELEEIRKNGITDELLRKIVKKHRKNAEYNRKLHERYKGVELPIFKRTPRFWEETNAINNKINNDFFGEIIDFKTGYFAGVPIGYGYSTTEESQEDTGIVGRAVQWAKDKMSREKAVDLAGKALTDFTTRNNMFDVDMETTKMAAICGYAARLFYTDTESNERVMPVSPYEAILLSDINMTEPYAGIRYFPQERIEDNKTVKRWKAEYYDTDCIRFYEGKSIGDLTELPELKVENVFDYCPLQGIPNNSELMGDAEKQIALIDAYDRALSDANNESEAFAHAYMVFENISISDKQIVKGQKAGSFQYFSGGQQGRIYFVTKEINDAFIEHHLDRLERNIYRFSKTPNLNDENFSQNASGVALKFKLHGLETKCGMFQAKMQSAGVYMFKLLASAWKKKGLAADPLQCTMDFHRNFPLDLLSEAQAAQALLNAGLPERIVYGQLSFVDDVDELMKLKEQQQADTPPPFYAQTDEERLNDTILAAEADLQGSDKRNAGEGELSAQNRSGANGPKKGRRARE